MNILYVGWCKDGTHDKVWGAISLTDPSPRLRHWDESKFVTFWGRRGKTLQTKIQTTSQYKIEREFEKKLDKGYKKISLEKLDEVYPEFREDLEKTAFWSILKS
jgi:hypothetical protein